MACAKRFYSLQHSVFFTFNKCLLEIVTNALTDPYPYKIILCPFVIHLFIYLSVVTSLIKLGYRSITLNSRIRGGVPLCRICDQYSCISACLVIGSKYFWVPITGQLITLCYWKPIDNSTNNSSQTESTFIEYFRNVYWSFLTWLIWFPVLEWTVVVSILFLHMWVEITSASVWELRLSVRFCIQLAG